jgi:DNA ligase-1
MNRFAELLDRLAYEPGRNNKLRLITAYFRDTPDPDRGYALAALTGALSFKHAKPGLIRDLIMDRTDPVLFGLSYDYVGDLSETVALMWPKSSPSPACGGGVGGLRPPSLRTPMRSIGYGWGSDRLPGGEKEPPPVSSDSARALPDDPTSPASGRGKEPPRPVTNLHNNPPPPTLSEVVTTLRTLGKTELPKQLARWLDELDETGRWALLKLVTGGMRIGISARLAKTAAAALGDKDPHEIELIWPGLSPPYLDLFAWLEGRGEKPVNRDPAPFRPVMLAHAIEDTDFSSLDPADFIAEWKWDGIRVQAVAGRDERGHMQARLYSRTGEDITKSFPDLVPSLHLPGAIDGELLVLREGRVQTFNVLQQRLNRKVVSPKLIKDFPIHLRAYDLLGDDENDLRELPFVERRAHLEAFVRKLDDPRIDLSPTIAFDSWEALMAARADPSSAGAGEDAEAVEGVMLKRRDAPYLPGRPKGQWWKWKRDPHIIDAVLMYAQRGHGKRSSYYSDYTFGVWTSGEDGEQLVPVGKAYFGFTDEELLQIDRFVRRNTTEKFGPVRHVVHEPDQGLVLEVAFEGLQRSPRHKSGVAMRFPRISRLRWDKPPREADRLETLERMLKDVTAN